MKTTIEIPNSILGEAKRLASQEKTTIRALVIESLRRILSERKKEKTFHLRKVTFKGKGLNPQLAQASWDHIRELVYEGHGG